MISYHFTSLYFDACGVSRAAGPFSSAAEGDELKHGLFTHAVPEGLDSLRWPVRRSG